MALTDSEPPSLRAASPMAVETSVLQDCVKEAKLLVDAAYNRTQGRWAWVWGLHGPGRADEGGWAPTKVTSPVSCPWVPWGPGLPSPHLPVYTDKLDQCKPDCAPPGMGICAVGLSPWISPPSSSSAQHQAAPSKRLCQSRGPSVLLQTAGSSHQENCAGS